MLKHYDKGGRMIRSEFVFFILLAGFLCSFLAPFFINLFKNKFSLLFTLVPLIFFLYFLSMASALPLDGSFFSVTSWVEVLAIDLTFRLDGLSLLFSLLITFFGTLIVFYSGKYLGSVQYQGRFFCLLFLFMVSMLGLVLSNHLLILFLFWELTTFSSFLLIGFNHQKEEARVNAWQAIMVTTLGALAMLAGFILLGESLGTYHLTSILERHQEVKEGPYFLPILILILMGALTKSAQFPFYFWLPNAMSAPTPISAYLHSVTMVKAGIYLLARLLPVLGQNMMWFTLLTVLGSLTMFIGALKALAEDDLKRILAYLTLTSLGLLTLLLGIGDPPAVKALITYLIVHSFYKGSLFLAVGTIDHEMGSREVSQLNGLLYSRPYLGVAISLGVVSMISLPPSLGFIAKELIFKASLTHLPLLLVIFIALVLTTFLGLSLLLRVIRPQEKKERIEEKGALVFPSLLLASLVTLAGLIPSWLELPFFKSIISSLTFHSYEGRVFAGIHFDQVLALSILTLLLSLAPLGKEQTFQKKVADLISFFSSFSPQKLYQEGMRGVVRIGKSLEKMSLMGYYHRYMTVILVSSVLALLYGINKAQSEMKLPEYTDLSFYEWGLVGVILLSTLSSILMTNLISSVMLLGVLGFSIAILFVSYGAPDLALTQLFVETLTIILFALIAIKFPRRHKHHFSSSETKKDLVLSLSMGSIVTMILLTISSKPFSDHLSRFYNDHSLTLAKGRNVVNVILVDFRALDTLGEITVLSIAGIGFFSLLKLGLRRKSP